jgi:hypothetical protein
MEAAGAQLELQHGPSRIDATAAAAMSLRSFQIRFLACVGLSAKAFARVLCPQAAIRAIDRAPNHSRSWPLTVGSPIKRTPRVRGSS